MRTKKTTAFTISQDLFADLCEVAKERRISRSALMDRALAFYLEYLGKEEQQHEVPGEGKPPHG